jgi:hypothetical protein
LGLLDSVVIAYINTPRRIIDYSFFSQAHILRKKQKNNHDVQRVYKVDKFPDQTLVLYSMKNFALNLQKLGQAVGRSLSARITRNPNPRYKGEDATLPELAFTSYFDFNRLGPPHAHHQLWEDQILFDTDTSTGAQWRPSDH